MKIFQFLSVHSLIISFLVLVIPFIILYPSKLISIDEHDYLANSYHLLANDLRHPCSENIPGQYPFLTVDGKEDGTCISKYNLGTSFFFLPAVLTSKEFAFLITFLAFIFGIFIFKKILDEYKINPIFIYLYSFYPSLVYFSRTLYSETFSATFITLTTFLLIKFFKTRKFSYGILVGIASGISILIRYSNAIPIGILILGFFIINFWPKVKPEVDNQSLVNKLTRSDLPISKNLAAVILGGLPLLIAFILINTNLYGGIFKTGYTISKEEIFILGNIPGLFIKYFGTILLIYPLMGLAFLIEKFLTSFKSNKFSKEKLVLFLAGLAVIILYSSYPVNGFEGRILDLVLAIRFIVPVLPLFLLNYASFLDNLLARKAAKLIIILVILFFGGLTIALQFVHEEYLNSNPVVWGDL